VHEGIIELQGVEHGQYRGRFSSASSEQYTASPAQCPMDEFVAAASRMARVLTVPLSVDIENGYSNSPKAVADLVRRLLDLGVAGINIEDGPAPLTLLASKIEAIRSAVNRAGADLFVNARTDIFLAGLAEESKRVDESIARARVYANAGADGVFIPGIANALDIETVAGSISLPLNVMAWSGFPNGDELGTLGVRRLSAGSGISQVLWDKARELATDFMQSGRSDPLSEKSMPYGHLQELFPRNVQVERT
jgi:2-methylisocitrate lyase-like PEP mutase family enzyme